jgi:hypothetical protein
MPKFKPIVRKPGELIRAEDWNKIQEEISQDIMELDEKISKLKQYIDSLVETTTILNPASPLGISYSLNENIPGERGNYMINVVGPITRQWALEKGRVGDLCRFGLATYLESLDYWAGAEDGDRKALEIVFEYVDGTSATVSGLFIHECSKLRPKGTDNPYIEYLLSPNERVWYRYRVKNPNPEKEVFNITFRKTDPACILKIGNAVHYRSKITTL